MIQAGDVVQITDERHPWFPALLVVDAVKSWGVQAYTVMVTNDPEPNGQAFIRLKTGVYERIGEAIILNKEKDV